MIGRRVNQRTFKLNLDSHKARRTHDQLVSPHASALCQEQEAGSMITLCCTNHESTHARDDDLVRMCPTSDTPSLSITAMITCFNARRLSGSRDEERLTRLEVCNNETCLEESIRRTLHHRAEFSVL